MLAGLLSSLKWLLVIAMVAGPLYACWTYSEAQTFKHVMADGVEADARVDRGEASTGGRSASSYKIHAIWTDNTGAEREESIEISPSYASRIIGEGFILIDSVNVKYLQDEPKVAAIVAEDGPLRIKDKELRTNLGAGTGVIGLTGSAIFLLTGRRRRPGAAKG
jgi:hypothetical protein